MVEKKTSDLQEAFTLLRAARDELNENACLAGDMTQRDEDAYREKHIMPIREFLHKHGEDNGY